VTVAKEDFLMVRHEMGRIPWWWQGAWLFITRELSVDHGRKGCLSFIQGKNLYAHVGFIAEDVPDLVATKDRKGLSPMDIVAVLTQVLKEKSQVIEDQQRTIEALEKTLTSVETRLLKTESEVQGLKSSDSIAQR
jgi:hypothetical protein